jgi:hypothetical protein
MIFSGSQDEIEKTVKRLVDTCNASRFDRGEMYKKRESYFLFGTDTRRAVKYNRLEAHLDLVASFLYAPDHAFYHIAAERNAPDSVIRQAVALQDDWNDDFQDGGLSDLFAEAIPWALTYDSMIYKLGWNEIRDEITAELIPPHNFGVYREDVADLDAQQAFCHTYFLDWHESVLRMFRAGRGSDISRLEVTNRPFVSPFPDMINRMIISATGGSNLQGNVVGQINPLYNAQATYQPQVDVPTVEWNELWAWDDRCQDYRVFHMVQPDILISDSLNYVEALWGIESRRRRMTVPKALVGRRSRPGTSDPFELFPDDFGTLATNGAEEGYHRSRCNLFLPRDHPFTAIKPFGKYNYFWGIAHSDKLFALQDWMTERIEQIADILEKQAYPPRVGSGLMGLTDEKMEAFGAADTWVYDQTPNAKIEELRPQMPPDLFQELNEIGQLFMEASGLTELIAGRGESGVRSAKQTRSQKETGGSRIKKAALRLESSLARIGDVGLRLKMRNDDEKIQPEPGEGEQEAIPFLAGQIASDVKIRVDGHSHSPLFADESREMAQLLKRAQAIDNEMFVRMLNPPGKSNIIHNIRQQQKKQAELMRAHPELLEKLAGGGRKGAKK